MAAALDFASFKTFVCTRAFDVIGNGSYRSFLVRCRDNNDGWAVDTYRAVCTLVDHVKQISALVAQMRVCSVSGLGSICRDVVSCTTPPTYGGSAWGVCHISGQHSAECVELMRLQHRHTQAVVVHRKYVLFLNLLWFVCKIEHVVRNFTRQWLRADPEREQASIAALCEAFSEQDAEFRSLFDVFAYGHAYVHASLTHHITHVHENAPLRV